MKTRRSAGILYISDGKLLLLKRSRTVRNSRKWGLPGGRRDAGESAWRTAQRESHEEMGGAPLAQILGELVIDRPGKRYRVFVCRAARSAVEGFGPVLNEEHTRARWVDLDWCLANTHKLHPVLASALSAQACRDELARVLSTGKGLRSRRASVQDVQVRTRAA